MTAAFKFEPRTQDTPHGPIDSNGDSVVHWRAGVLSDTILGAPFGALRAGYLAGVSDLAERAAELSAVGFNKAATAFVRADLVAPFKAAQTAARAARDSSASALAKPLAPVFGPETPPQARAEMRAWARSQKMADLVPLALADPTLAAAMVEGGQPMSGLPSDVFERIRDVMVRHNLATFYAPYAEFRTTPNADDPVADLPDAEALKGYVDEIIANHRKAADAAAAAPKILAEFVTAIATLTDARREDAFTLLTGAAA